MDFNVLHESSILFTALLSSISFNNYQTHSNLLATIFEVYVCFPVIISISVLYILKHFSSLKSVNFFMLIFFTISVIVRK